VSEFPGLLDSSQAEIVFNYAQHFPNETQLSICIITGDSEKYVGILRRNDSLVYINNSDSVFEIGSITKTFTGTMLAKLVYSGKVDPNEPIKNLLPVHLNQSSLNGEEITLIHLANHTSGLPFEPTNVRDNKEHPFDPYSPYRYYDTTRLYDYLSHQMALQSTPGEKRTYSNLGGGLLGHILTLISRKSYEELLFETVCAPLGMKNTFVILNAERKQSMVRGRNPKGQVIPYDDGDCGALTGAGGIKSSVKDLVKYLKANISDTTYFYLSQKTTKIFDEHFTGGLGWATYSDLGKHHVGAFGATGGYTSGVIFERNEHVGVVVLTNVSAFLASQGNYTEGLCRGLYDPLPFTSKRK
jgi:CubicO group peptidase (beta-lactamase class C family)